MGKHSVELSLRHLKDSNFGRNTTQNPAILALSAPHVDSFNFFLEEGLSAMLSDLPPSEFELLSGHRVSVWIKEIMVGSPRLSGTDASGALGKDTKIYPRECVERGTSYTAPISAIIEWVHEGVESSSFRQALGDFPIMVRSKKCNLHGMDGKELMERGELVNETGGYFIINGACRILRLLNANRRNFPLAVIRETWKKRDDAFTEKGVMIRCVRDDQSSTMNILHYLTTGMAKLEFTLKKEMFFVPLIMCLKALMNYTDHQIYQHLMKGREKDIYLSQKIKAMMRELQENQLYNQDMCKEYIGKSFRHRVADSTPEWYTDKQICDFLFHNQVLIHLKNNSDKFETLCLMARKLYAFVGGDCKAESVDAVSMQEVAMGGHVYLLYLKEKLMDLLRTVKYQIIAKNKKEGPGWAATDNDVKRAAVVGKGTGHMFESFIATGSLNSKTGCGLMQMTGLTVSFDHLNRMRDMSHLRAIHRGTFFLDMKLIEPRRLTGEAWGFICPVHTPDGAPCGLLNHLSQDCVIPSREPRDQTVLRALNRLGMTPLGTPPLRPYAKCLEVVLDGALVGHVPQEEAQALANELRIMKTQQEIYKFTEIVMIAQRKYGGQYPGVFLMTSPARMMRPVVHLDTHTVEYIGTLEQLYLNIAVTPEDIEQGVHTHVEVDKRTIFSNVGKLVPFSDCNPNPRNMYQCQMGKQTMGTPFHNWRSQTTSKAYRLQYPQVPLVRNAHYDNINMEEFCMGFNAVVAIVSYTGYDMEDAMVLNKCAMERGLAHGQIYKTEFVDLSKIQAFSKIKNAVNFVFSRNPASEKLRSFLDHNGLPYPGSQLTEGNPYYCVYDVRSKRYRETTYRGEDCVVDKCSILTSNLNDGECQCACITIRIKRNPIIGDKFASRSGQKGILSILYPPEDLPFSERGIMPDIIFNPHGIPSRMTAGKLLELVAGKSAAEFGKSFDSTPFEFSDEDPAVDYFGKILEKAGFNYYGEDVLYSGVDGRMMEVEIFEGIIYYQRLRHMTSDKYQVRATGAVDIVTRQPVKGRRRGGAIRFGEMERDCLISHGAAYTLKDRLLDCSDLSIEWVCSMCGSLISPSVRLEDGTRKYGWLLPQCTVCGPEAEVKRISLPYAFKYLVTELASVGIKTQLGLQSADKMVKVGNVVKVKNNNVVVKVDEIDKVENIDKVDNIVKMESDE
ncbi:hypothetical protein Pcinc_027812 [Petrolisthes cinctipes]|uniref:DNA-directed RNA polymerase subunit beta n=1 Tax=Petrolisthes cinctipes TaxID=88211 RepID=A0AAE1K876_PETCI|nr:hypothetical protein Pcinc_027812 [Petrolisthes cinctipes]